MFLKKNEILSLTICEMVHVDTGGVPYDIKRYMEEFLEFCHNENITDVSNFFKNPQLVTQFYKS